MTRDQPTLATRGSARGCAQGTSVWGDGLRGAVREALRPRQMVSATLVAASLAGPGSAALAGSFPGEFELSTLAGGGGAEGFVLNGIYSGNCTGCAVSGAGDVNGDGIDDLVIGARFASTDVIFEGESYVVFGRPSGTAFSGTFELSSLAGGGGTDGFVLPGFIWEGQSGIQVSGVGDVNGDGIDDLIIGALVDEIDFYETGESYVVFGRPSGTAFPGVFELSSLDGSNGFALYGIDSRDRAGRAVGAAGDVNGDGIDDLIVGAWDADPNGDSSGESYVVFGRETRFPGHIELSSLLPANGGDGTEGFVLNGIDAGDRSGNRVGGVGDINGDGIDDLFVGAWYADPNGNIDAGEAYVVFGRLSGTAFPPVFELSTLAGGGGADGFVLNGIDAGDWSGRKVSAAGDINGDGLKDLIIGALFADPNGNTDAGESYVIFGRPSGSVFPGTFDLSTLAGGGGVEGFVLNGIDAYDFSGLSVSAAGDVNGDGIDDLIVGAISADPNGNNDAGESYVVFGRPSGSAFPGTFELSTLAGGGADGFVINGIDAGDRSGGAVSAAGDVNGDTIDDLIIGAGAADESYVVFGRCGQTEALSAGVWQQIALPCAPGAANTVAAILGDDLDGVHGTDWFVYRRDEAMGNYVALAPSDVLEAGEGYWILTTQLEQKVSLGTDSADARRGNGEVIDIALTGEAAPVSEGCGSSAGQCNMVGHPRHFDVCWADVTVDDGGAILTLDQADPGDICQTTGGAGCILSSIAYKWTGSAYASFNGATPGMEGTLNPWDGLWVSANKPDIKLRIPGTWGSNCTTAPVRQPGGGWYIRLIAESGPLRDAANVFGQLADSQHGYDRHDLPELAPFGESYLTVVFPHDEWDKYAGDYTSDYHPVNPWLRADMWQFEVRAGDPDSFVTLSWEDSGEGKPRWRYAELTDLESGANIPASLGSYKFRMQGGSHRFRWTQHQH